LGPGVKVEPGAKIIDSVLLTDTIVRKDAMVARSVLDKRVEIAQNVVIGSPDAEKPITMVGKNSLVPTGILVEPGAVINADVVESDYPGKKVYSDQLIEKTRRLPNDL
jgi:glucose-1-phosphate adenylyltransferase